MSSTATAGANVSTSSSWKLETSQTIGPPGSTSPTSALNGRPTLPATGAARMCPSSSLVVVFPFVPVTARSGLSGRSRNASSISLQTGMPVRARSLHERCLPGTPGLFDEHVDALEERELLVVAERPVGAGHLDAAASSAARAASPERARPSTSAALHSGNCR